MTRTSPNNKKSKRQAAAAERQRNADRTFAANAPANLSNINESEQASEQNVDMPDDNVLKVKLPKWMPSEPKL